MQTLLHFVLGLDLDAARALVVPEPDVGQLGNEIVALRDGGDTYGVVAAEPVAGGEPELVAESGELRVGGGHGDVDGNDADLAGCAKNVHRAAAHADLVNADGVIEAGDGHCLLGGVGDAVTVPDLDVDYDPAVPDDEARSVVAEPRNVQTRDAFPLGFDLGDGAGAFQILERDQNVGRRIGELAEDVDLPERVLDPVLGPHPVGPLLVHERGVQRREGQLRPVLAYPLLGVGVVEVPVLASRVPAQDDPCAWERHRAFRDDVDLVVHAGRLIHDVHGVGGADALERLGLVLSGGTCHGEPEIGFVGVDDPVLEDYDLLLELVGHLLVPLLDLRPQNVAKLGGRRRGAGCLAVLVEEDEP